MLSTHQEAPGSITGTAVRFFSSEELFLGMYGLDISVSHVHVPSCDFLGESAYRSVRPTNCARAPIFSP